MSVNQPFNPAYQNGQTVTTGASSARIEIGEGSKTLCLTNTGANYCYVRTGDSTVEADSSDYIVPPGAQVTITKAQDWSYLAYIQLTGATTLNVIPGEGW